MKKLIALCLACMLLLGTASVSLAQGTSKQTYLDQLIMRSGGNGDDRSVGVNDIVVSIRGTEQYPHGNGKEVYFNRYAKITLAELLQKYGLNKFKPGYTFLRWEAFFKNANGQYITQNWSETSRITRPMVITAIYEVRDRNWYYDATGMPYLTNAFGQVLKGWQMWGGHWYYFFQNGKMAQHWQFINQKWYYLGENGQMHTGWLTLGGAKYYLVPSGEMLTGKQNINGVDYTFNASGVLESQKDGWQLENGKWYYYKNGLKQTGWLSLGNTWYYLQSDGAMHTGWLQLGTIRYYLNQSGIMLTGTHNIGGVNYTFNNGGALVENIVKDGWKLENGKWYYYKNNIKQTGWLLDGNTWYFLEQNGTMKTGWLTLGNTKYYLAPSGAMLTGTHNIGGQSYTFNASGALVENVAPAKNGWVLDNSIWYFYKNNVKHTGWLQQGNVWYYLDQNGQMLTGRQNIDGVQYFFNDQGVWVPGVKSQDVVEEIITLPEPTLVPTAEPTLEPTAEPAVEPTIAPVAETTPSETTAEPTLEPTLDPTLEATTEPTPQNQVVDEQGESATQNE